MKHDNWKAPEGAVVPDFIICGAMKCGTSTVHALLNTHPDVFIPDPEIHFFDNDDIFQHADFFFHENNAWSWPDFSRASAKHWQWYQDFFKDAPEGALIGEDSTCYIASPNAAKRIALQDKAIKTIVCLRQPTKRAYSQYLHMLRSGRAMFNFEDTIKYTPNYVLERSMYLPQIESFLQHIPKERVYFFVLEEFLADKQKIINEMCDFLGLDQTKLPAEAVNTHTNKAKIPKNIELQALKNRILRTFGNAKYVGLIPSAPDKLDKRSKLIPFVVNKLHTIFNPSDYRPSPKIKPETNEFLDRYFEQQLKGLGEIIGKDLEQLWFKK